MSEPIFGPEPATTEPTRRGYCPWCHAGGDDLYEERGRLFCECGWEGEESYLKSHDEMVRDAREDVRLHRADL